MALVISLAMVFNIYITMLGRSYAAFDGNPDTVGLQGVTGDVHDAGAAVWGAWLGFYSASTKMTKLFQK